MQLDPSGRELRPEPDPGPRVMTVCGMALLAVVAGAALFLVLASGLGAPLGDASVAGALPETAAVIRRPAPTASSGTDASPASRSPATQAATPTDISPTGSPTASRSVPPSGSPRAHPDPTPPARRANVEGDAQPDAPGGRPPP